MNAQFLYRVLVTLIVGCLNAEASLEFPAADVDRSHNHTEHENYRRTHEEEYKMMKLSRYIFNTFSTLYSSPPIKMLDDVMITPYVGSSDGTEKGENVSFKIQPYHLPHGCFEIEPQNGLTYLFKDGGNTYHAYCIFTVFKLEENVYRVTRNLYTSNEPVWNLRDRFSSELTYKQEGVLHLLLHILRAEPQPTPVRHNFCANPS